MTSISHRKHPSQEPLLSAEHDSTSKKVVYTRLLMSISEGFKNEENIRHWLPKANTERDILKLNNALKLVLDARVRAQTVIELFRKKYPAITKSWDAELASKASAEKSKVQ